MNILRSLLRALGPTVPRSSPAEALRAGFGALLGLGVTGYFVMSPTMDLEVGLFLVAPFGASSLLLFAVPNSPLAQPFSAIVGNTIGALVGVAVCMAVRDPAFSIPLSVGGAVAATILCRAVHPPAAAMAMTAAMSPEAVDQLGFWFALTPVATGTAILVLLATVYARLTGRRYPFRQFDEPKRQGAGDAGAKLRLGLSETDLTGILERYRQSYNLGVEDLARLIAAAELEAAARHVGPLTAGDMMSHSLVTVGPDATVVELVELFHRHRLAALPVVGAGGRFLGIVSQINLIDRAREEAMGHERRLLPALRRLVDPERDRPVRAAEIMSLSEPRATPTTPIAALLPILGEAGVDTVPVLERGRIVGVVGRADMIVALARRRARAG